MNSMTISWWWHIMNTEKYLAVYFCTHSSSYKNFATPLNVTFFPSEIRDLWVCQNFSWGSDHFTAMTFKFGQLLTKLFNFLYAKNKFWEKATFLWTSSILHKYHSKINQIQIFTYIICPPFLGGCSGCLGSFRPCYIMSVYGRWVCPCLVETSKEIRAPGPMLFSY